MTDILDFFLKLKQNMLSVERVIAVNGYRVFPIVLFFD